MNFKLSASVIAIAAALTSASAGAAPMAQANASPSKTYDIEITERRLDRALSELAQQAGFQLLIQSEDVKGVKAGLRAGRYTYAEALEALLMGTNLTFKAVEGGAVAIVPKGAAGVQSISYATGYDYAQGVAVTEADERMDEVSSKDVTFEEIIVTATKREARVQEVPISIAALGERELRERGIENMLDLSLAVPNVSITDNGTSFRKVTIRGIGNSIGSSALVGVYVDEISATVDPSYQLDLRLHDIKRVEVLRGPQGTLYGEGSTGGTIRFITNEPNLSEYEGSLSLEASNTKEGGANFDLKSVLNVPVARDKMALRVSGSYARESGWIDQPDLKLQNINHQEVLNLRTQLMVLPAENLELRATVVLHRNDAGAPNYAEDEDGNFEQLYGLQIAPRSKDDYELYNLTANYDFGWANLLSTSSYISSDKVIRFSGSVFPDVAPPAEPMLQFIDKLSIASTAFTQELRMVSVGDSAFQWTFGGFYRDMENAQVFNDVSLGVASQPPFVLPIFTRVNNSKSWAVFGETSAELGSSFQVGVGARYFEDERTYESEVFGIDTDSGDFHSFNPRFFARYDMSDDVHFYGSVSKGFRSGGFNGGGLPAYDPESVWTYEVGTKFTAVDRRLVVDLAAFYSEYTDIQVNAVVPLDGILQNFVSNVAAAEVKGIEGSISWELAPDFEVGFNGNWTDAELVRVDSPDASHQEGDSLDLVPEYSFGAWSAYEFDVSDAIRGRFRVDYNQQGPSDYRNRQIGAHFFSQSDEINMLNARLALSKDAWTVEAFVDNLLNERGFVDPTYIELLAARPRPLTAGIRVSFDFQ